MESFKPGIYPGVSNDDYHAALGLSFSGLKEFAITPSHFQAYLRKEHDDTPARRLGRGVHARVLEPARFAKDYRVVGDRRTVAGKAAVAEAEKLGLEILNENEAERVQFMAGAILNHRKASLLLQNGEAESSVFSEIDGVLRKCRPDYFRRTDGIVVDIKTYSDDLSLEELRRQGFRMKYHWQSAWYLDVLSSVVGEKLKHFVHIFVGDADPWPVRVVEYNDASLEKARFEYAPLLEQFRECQESGDWPGYDEDEILDMDLPSYAW